MTNTIKDYITIPDLGDFILGGRYLINEYGDIYDVFKAFHRSSKGRYINLTNLNNVSKLFCRKKLLYWSYKGYKPIDRSYTIKYEKCLHIDNLELVKSRSQKYLANTMLPKPVLKTIKNNINILTHKEIIEKVRSKYKIKLYNVTLVRIKQRKAYTEEFRDIIFVNTGTKRTAYIRKVRNAINSLYDTNIIITMDIIVKKTNNSIRRKIIKEIIDIHFKDKLNHHHEKLIRNNPKYIVPLSGRIGEITVIPYNYVLVYRFNKITVFEYDSGLYKQLIKNMEDVTYEVLTIGGQGVKSKVSILDLENYIEKYLKKLKSIEDHYK